jgi:hypothetical protein
VRGADARAVPAPGPPGRSAAGRVPGLAEYGQEHDPAISSTPVRITGCCVGPVLRSCDGIEVPKIRTSASRRFPGSQTGSQRPQLPGHARPYPAIATKAKQHVRPHPALPGHVSKVSPKQYAVGSSPTRGAAQRSNACSLSVVWEPNWEPANRVAAPWRVGTEQCRHAGDPLHDRFSHLRQH